MANATNTANAPVPNPNAEPKSFHLYTGSGKTPLVLQIFAGLMWLNGLGAILQGIPLLLFFGIGIIPIVLGVLIIKYARGIFKMEAKAYKGVFVLNAISILFLVAAKLVSGWPISVDSTFVIQIFAVGLTLLIFYLYKPKFEETVKTFFWDKIILIVLAAFIIVFGGLYFYQQSHTVVKSALTSQDATQNGTSNSLTNAGSQQQTYQDNSNASALTNSTPQSWNAYTNAHFNYTVTYPSNWNYKEETYSPITNVQFVDFGINSADSQTITLSNDPNPYQHNTLDEYSKNYNTNDSTEQSRSKITVNGKPAIQIISKDGLITTLIMRDADHQVFDWLYWNTSPEDKQIYDTMLQKFKY
jgi:hypothetical protein